MKPIKHIFRIAAVTVVLAASQQTLAAAYIKLGDIKGESRSAVPASTTGFHHGGAGKANFRQQSATSGGLDRDIIRRQTGTEQQRTTRLPKVGATNLHGVEPDEID